LGNEKRKFSREIDAGNANEAKEKIFSLFGSEHACKRRNVEIKTCKEIKE